MSRSRRPQAVVIAGPNGAGKTSAAPDLLRDTIGIEAFVNADVIAAGLAGFDPASAAIEAGRITLRRLRELAAARENFGFESTLAGRSARTLLGRLIRDGYEVHIMYLWLPSADFAVARVQQRIADGGHAVPDTDIRRRFRRSLVNFDRLYRPIVTTWQLFDGSAVVGRPVIAHGTNSSEPVVIDAATWKQIQKQLGGAR